MSIESNQFSFSTREKDVIKLLLQGKSNKQIALELGISNRTVEFHLGNIYSKLGVTSRTETFLKLSESPLWESTGNPSSNVQVDSTVEQVGDSTENGVKPILRRIVMKNLSYLIGGGLLTTVLIVFMVVSNLPAQRLASTPTLPIEQTPTTSSENPIATPLLPTQAPTALPTINVNASPQSSTADVAHFVSENYPDGSKIEKGVIFTKTWILQNNGSTTWTTDYFLVLTDSMHPLGKNLNEPYQIKLPKSVSPGETVEISADFKIPDADGIYEVHYRLQNANGQTVSGDGSAVWLKVVVGNAQLGSNSVQAGNVTMTLINVQKGETVTNVEICAQLPDTRDWNLNGVLLIAGNVQNSLSGYMLKNPKDASIYSSAYRCYIVEFPVGVNNYGTSPVSISISNIRVPAENNLTENCVRAKRELASQYPGLDFTCGTAGFYYTNPIIPSGLSESQADKIIMDALEQAIYGNWLLSE
jgi:DNA-binding CsgD family transcriptional regulator